MNEATKQLAWELSRKRKSKELRILHIGDLSVTHKVKDQLFQKLALQIRNVFPGYKDKRLVDYLIIRGKTYLALKMANEIMSRFNLFGIAFLLIEKRMV